MSNPFTQFIESTLRTMLNEDPELVKQTLVPDLLEMELKYFVVRNNTKQAVPTKELTIGECLTASVLVKEQALQIYQQTYSQALDLVLQKTPDRDFFRDKQ